MRELIEENKIKSSSWSNDIEVKKVSVNQCLCIVNRNTKKLKN